jgi:hypothetical protein
VERTRKELWRKRGREGTYPKNYRTKDNPRSKTSVCRFVIDTILCWFIGEAATGVLVSDW